MRLLDQTATLTSRDTKRHLPIPFTLAAGTTHLNVGFTYGRIDGQAGQGLLSLSLFDPNEARGAGHCRDDNNIRLSAHYATPGFIPGDLNAGEWTLVIDTHMVLPNGDLTYTLTIDADSDPVTETAPDYRKPTFYPQIRGWYRGDLHGHTIHSDGQWDVPDRVAEARARGLDFVTLTDHNTPSPLPQIDSLATPELLTMGGIELTTYYGHCLALGVRHWVEWRINPHDGSHYSMRELAAMVTAGGGLFVIAHPMAPGDPVCTGCDWQYPDMMPGTAGLVEVWNGEWSAYNEDGLALWYRWLNEGHHLTATAGTDTHGPASQPQPRLGFNVVYAEALTEPAILAAVRDGRSYLSADGFSLILTAKASDGRSARMGETIAAKTGESIAINVIWTQAANLPGTELKLIVNGQPFESITPDQSGSHAWAIPVTANSWIVAELRDAAGQMCALTNPIFVQMG